MVRAVDAAGTWLSHMKHDWPKDAASRLSEWEGIRRSMEETLARLRR